MFQKPSLTINCSASSISRPSLPHSSPLYSLYPTCFRQVLQTTHPLLIASYSVVTVTTQTAALLEPSFQRRQGLGVHVRREEGAGGFSYGFTGVSEHGGGVAMPTKVKNPIPLARELLVRGDGDGVRAVGRDINSVWEQRRRGWLLGGGVKFWTGEAMGGALMRVKGGERPELAAFVMDTYRTLCVAMSTGSLANKLPGRIGDTPILATRPLIESRFPGPTYEYHNDLSPRVSVHHCFDSGAFPIDHLGRSRTDHYCVNKGTILRTFTSVHHADTFRSGTSDGFLGSADVYRLGAIDRSHYPYEVEGMPRHGIDVEDPNPPFYEMRNPLQVEHTPEEARAIGAHLRLCLEHVGPEEFGQARAAAAAAGDAGIEGASEEPLRVRWVEAYFPFTQPFLGARSILAGESVGIVREWCSTEPAKECQLVNHPPFLLSPHNRSPSFQASPKNSARPSASASSQSPRSYLESRVLASSGPSTSASWRNLRKGRFPDSSHFSKFPHRYKDDVFWLPSSSSAAGCQIPFHENDMMDVINVAGDLAEDEKFVSNFVKVEARERVCQPIFLRRNPAGLNFYVVLHCYDEASSEHVHRSPSYCSVFESMDHCFVVYMHDYLHAVPPASPV
ncbi:hypothetical protein B9Z19DRAFT_1123648 [Tuber borchii]|uniref:Uncharacterized protein n=1 Tax=Tuber borchii TaxID=42251 RepID=A0A2T6ZY48_TUBBO|nr:hypothetical protein B9Z19DRAFT_1123648 [Tuber borchii]